MQLKANISFQFSMTKAFTKFVGTKPTVQRLTVDTLEVEAIAKDWGADYEEDRYEAEIESVKWKGVEILPLLQMCEGTNGFGDPLEEIGAKATCAAQDHFTSKRLKSAA